MTSPRPRFLSEADCHEIAQRLARFAAGGGTTTVAIVSTWRGSVRWARNLVSSMEEVRNNNVFVNRSIRGAWNRVEHINAITDEALVAAARRAERLARQLPERAEYDLPEALPAQWRLSPEPFTAPSLFFEATYQLDAGHRAAAARQGAQAAAAAGMLSAGYVDVTARSLAQISSVGWARYFQYTWAQYSVTVRDPAGTGSGWAGVDWPDWSRIDGPQLSARALDKCLRSRHPVAVEPGRYTTLLEPQAVGDMMVYLKVLVGRLSEEQSNEAPWNKSRGPEVWWGPYGHARYGERVVDERLTIDADPTDPDLAGVPFVFPTDDMDGDIMIPREVYHPVTWIEQGVLKNLEYPQGFGIAYLNRKTGLESGGSFRIRVHGEQTSMAEMIATTPRGLLVTRFDAVKELSWNSTIVRGYTRDGLWLIEHGKITKAVQNMVFTESVLFALNNVEQLGVPQRIFNPPGDRYNDMPYPVIVPPMKIKDFSFTALADSV